MGIPIRAIEVKNSGYIEDGRFVSTTPISHSRHLTPMTEQEWINTIVQPSMNGFEPGAHYDLGSGWSKLKGFTVYPALSMAKRKASYSRGSLSRYK
ncbi:hypothetical protein E4U30_007091 [Claviceps sp. LM220 group G6]|nr:hypothetical protein E4U30_007091 [Claviceps sp. LM220 group G6]KAG6106743.1 hypothetical protein E4U31_000621 [Claviceps sp. LM219 group G6]KAG6121866.1 hypothetical protein E4U14_001023 [Claviceps sp. LM454 group G7]